MVGAHASLSVAAATVVRIREAAIEADRIGFPVPLTLFNVSFLVPKLPKGPRIDFGGDTKAERKIQKERNDFITRCAAQVFASELAKRFNVDAAAASSRMRDPHACESHPSGEVFWFPVDGLAPDGRHVSGIFTVCVECVAVNHFDDAINIGLYRISAEPTSQEADEAKQEVVKEQKPRKRGKSNHQPAALAAG